MTQSTSDKRRPLWTARTVFQSPFSTNWPPIDPNHSSQCLETLRQHYPNQGQKRRRRLRTRQHAPNKRRRTTIPTEKTSKTEREKKNNEDNAGISIINKDRVCVSVAVNVKPPGLVFGLNEVTKAIEKGRLDVAIVCKDTQPHLLVRHIPVLCYVGKVTLVGVLGGGADLGAIFGMKRLIAVGVLKTKEDVKELGDKLKELKVKLEFPWLDNIEISGCWKTWYERREERKDQAKGATLRFAGRRKSRKRLKDRSLVPGGHGKKAMEEAVALGEAVQASAVQASVEHESG